MHTVVEIRERSDIMIGDYSAEDPFINVVKIDLTIGDFQYDVFYEKKEEQYETVWRFVNFNNVTQLPSF